MLQLDNELSIIKLEVVRFSETQPNAQDFSVTGVDRLICSNDTNARSPASGVAVLVHRRWTKSIARKICLHDRVIFIDLKIAQKIIRVIAVYLPHMGYDWNYFINIFTDIEGLVMEAMNKGYTLVLAGDFNLTLDQGQRGDVMKELCTTFSLEIANGRTMADSSDTWTWKSSYGQFRRIDYILHSKRLRSFNISANRELDLGSDHRNVSASIEYCRSPEHWKVQKKSFKGWKPIRDASHEPHLYHAHLQRLIHEYPSASLHDL